MRGDAYGLREYAMRVPLVDGHAHALFREAPDARRFAQALFLTDLPERNGGIDDIALGRLLESRLGCETARRFGALVGMDAPGCSREGPRGYWRARVALEDLDGFGTSLLRRCGVSVWVLDTGAAAGAVESPESFAARVADVPRVGHVVRLVRLEHIAEQVLRGSDDGPDAGSGGGRDDAAAFPERFRAALDAALADHDVVGCKSVAAYRTGFAIDWTTPADDRVVAAVHHLTDADRTRLSDPILESFIVNEALRRGVPVQFHVGFGDGEARVHDCDPTLLEPLTRIGAPIVLLHCAPYERQAAWMCAVHGNVHMDLSLAMMHAGVTGARGLLERALQWCPFDRLLYASDGFGVAETHALGALVWREAFGGLAADWVACGLWDAAHARRVINAVAHGNAERLYGLGSI